MMLQRYREHLSLWQKLSSFLQEANNNNFYNRVLEDASMDIYYLCIMKIGKYKIWKRRRYIRWNVSKKSLFRFISGEVGDDKKLTTTIE